MARSFSDIHSTRRHLGPQLSVSVSVHRLSTTPYRRAGSRSTHITFHSNPHITARSVLAAPFLPAQARTQHPNHRKAITHGCEANRNRNQT